MIKFTTNKADCCPIILANNLSFNAIVIITANKTEPMDEKTVIIVADLYCI